MIYFLFFSLLFLAGLSLIKKPSRKKLILAVNYKNEPSYRHYRNPSLTIDGDFIIINYTNSKNITLTEYLRNEDVKSAFTFEDNNSSNISTRG